MWRRSLGQWAFKMRGGLWTLLFVVILIMAERAGEQPLSQRAEDVQGTLFAGLALVAAGQLWRFWAAGCIGRYRGETVGAQRLATWGPYALMRNPLYFGNGLIGLGWALMAGRWTVPVFIVGFIVIYILLIIPREEDFLAEKFGAEYEDYRRRIGMFWPRSVPSGIAGPFDSAVLWRSERHTVLTTVAGTLLIIGRVIL